MTAARSHNYHSPRLTLFSGDDAADAPDETEQQMPSSPPVKTPPPSNPQSKMKLRQWFTEILLKVIEDRIELVQRSKATLALTWTTIQHWEDLTTNPNVGAIAEETIGAFRKRLIKEPFTKGKSKTTFKRSNQTVNKIMRHLRPLIRSLWPADSHNPRGAGLIPYFEWPEELKRQKTFTFTFDRKQLSALYLACSAAKPGKVFSKSAVHDPLKWRTALVLALNTGARTWDLFALKWSDIQWDDFRHGSVWFQSRKTAKVQRVPLNKVARTHLAHLRTMNPDSTFIFEGFSKTRAFYSAWDRISAVAGTSAPFESLRKTCSTLHDDVLYGVGSFLLGHSTRGVNATSYDNPTPRVMRTVYAMRCPAEFRRGAKLIADGRSQST